MSDTCDAVVVGAGVIGCSIALELARAGRRVVVVDRGPSPGAGATSASSAIVRFTYSTWTGVAVSWEGKHGWDAWQDHLEAPSAEGLARFVRTGGVLIESPEQDVVRVLGHLDRAGVPHERWDADTLRRHYPALDVGRYWPPKPVEDEGFWADAEGEVGAVWTPDAGHVDDPQQATVDLARAAERQGTVFRFRSPVIGVDRSGDRVRGVRLADGHVVSAPVVVNAAGAHAERITALAGALDDVAVRSRPLRQEVQHVPAPPGFGAEGPVPFVADLDLGTYVRWAPGGSLLIGGTEPDCDPLEWLDDADDCSPNPTRAVRTAHLYRAARRIPGLTVPEASRGIAAVYDVTDDWIPVYDRTSLGGFYIAAGTSGNQFKNAPVVGRLLAELVRACEDGHDHDADPVQVVLRRSGLAVDLGHYSRRRAVNRDSSFSVMG